MVRARLCRASAGATDTRRQIAPVFAEFGTKYGCLCVHKRFILQWLVIACADSVYKAYVLETRVFG